MLATALTLARTLSEVTGFAWSAVSADRVTLTLPSGWEHTVWVGTTTTEQATADATRFVRTYGI